MEFLVLIILALVIVIVWVHILVAKGFSGVADAKGYEEDAYLAMCIFAGLPAWLLVMALPNKTYHKELLDVLRNKRDIEK